MVTSFQKQSIFRYMTASMIKESFVKDCDSENKLDESNCYVDFITSKMGCQVPWHNFSDIKLCETSEELQEYLKLRLMIHQNELDEELEQHGCISKSLKNCESYEWPLREAAKYTLKLANHFVQLFKWNDTVDVSNEKVVVFAFEPENKVEFLAEYYIYGIGNLVADTGGYMGLFLGASILTIFELILNVLKKVF